MHPETTDVVHVVNQLRPGGIETMVIDIVRHSRYRSVIVSLESSRSELLKNWPELASLGLRIEGFDKKPGLQPGLAVRLAQRLRYLQPKAVFLHRTNPLLYGGIAARIAGVPNIVHVEHDVWQYQVASRLRLLQWSARMVRPVHFAISQEIADALRGMLKAPQIQVVPGGVDLERYQRRDKVNARATLGLPLDAAVIGTAGRLEPVKGHSVLIAALARMPENVHGVFVGDGSQRQSLSEQARDLGIAGRVTFLGHRDDLETILPAMDVFCLPSHGEGLPRVLMEAQSADIAIVASDVGSVRQLLEPTSGRLVPPGDPIALAEALGVALAEPATAGVCRAHAVARFGIDRMVSAYDGVIIQTPAQSA